MLALAGVRQLGSGRIEVRAALGRSCTAVVVRKSGLVFDSAFAPPEAAPVDNDLLFFLLGGRFELVQPSPAAFVGPAALHMSEADFEGSAGRRGVRFRTLGDDFCSVQLRLPPGAVSGPPGPRPIVVGEPVWRAVRAVGAAERDALAAETTALLRVLVEAGLVRPGLAEETREVDAFSDRLGAALAPGFAELDALATVKSLAGGAGLSLRTLARELSGFFASIPFVGRSFRELAVRSRFKLAVHALSVPELSLVEVARVCGYGSADAMSRAFRDAGLPIPSRVRALMAEVDA